jgi:shikimate dehydrogenase
MKRAFIIGSPISHSLSPHLHGFWLEEYDIDGSYEALNVPPEYLVKTVKKLAEKGYVGGNVTIPHKEKVLMICDEVDPLARKVGAVNTLVFNGTKITGYNTDVFGFLENLRSAGVDFSKIKNALVIGAGGASRAVICGLKENNIEVTLTNRTQDNAIKLATEFGTKVVDWNEKDADLSGFDLVINTTSLGLKGESTLDINLATLPKTAVVHDIVYNPLQTEFLKQANALGLKTVDGLGMLLYQAVPGFEKWFGKHPTVTPELREHLLKCFT